MEFASCEEANYFLGQDCTSHSKVMIDFLMLTVCTPVGLIQYRQGEFFCFRRILRPEDLKSGSEWLTASIIDLIIITSNKSLSAGPSVSVLSFCL